MKYLIISALAFLGLAMTPHSGALHVGDIAPDFNLKNVDGNMVSMASMEDAKGYIVIFSCNHCPYVKLYEDRMIALDKEFAKQGYPVIAINSNDPEEYPTDSYEAMQVRAKEKGFTFPYLVDETQATAKAYGATRTPHVYLLHKQESGDLKVAYIGAIDDDTQDSKKDKDKVKYVANAIAAITNGSTPDPSTTKAIGCSIKWKK